MLNQASMKELRHKSKLLVTYLEQLLLDRFINNDKSKSTISMQVITSSNLEERGNQLSIYFPHSLDKVYEELRKRGMVVRIKFVTLFLC